MDLFLLNRLISPGSDEADQVLRVLLETGMFIGGILGFLLDNTIPGKLVKSFNRS